MEPHSASEFAVLARVIPCVGIKSHVDPLMSTTVHDLHGRSTRGVRIYTVPAVMPWRNGHMHDADTSRPHGAQHQDSGIPCPGPLAVAPTANHRKCPLS